jgi:predicted ribosomally synthesized peptide with SipW-like signal peptide
MGTRTDTTETTDRRSRRRGVVILKFGLAGAALLGIAAAATSAAWTDNAWFSASAHAATVKLTASTSLAGPFSNADTGNGGTSITFGAAEYGQLNQNVTKPVTLYLQNEGSVALTVTAVTTTGTGGIFTAAGSDPGTADDAATVTSDLVAGTVIPAGAIIPFTVTLQTPVGWLPSFEGKTGVVTTHVAVTS